MCRFAYVLKSLLLSLFLSWITTCYGQSPSYYNLSALYDFNAKTIYSLYQAKNKHIWIATDQGLFRFNGSTFKKYLNPEYRNEFHNLQEDKEGRIWCSNFAGQLFYVEDNALTFFKDVNSYTTSGVLSFTVAHFPKLYIGTEYGYIIADFYTKDHIKHFQTHIYYKNDYKVLHNKDTIYRDNVSQIQPYKNEFIYLSGLIPDGQLSINILQEGRTEHLATLTKSGWHPTMISHNDTLVTLSQNQDKKPQIQRYQNHTMETKVYDDFPTPVRSVFYYDTYMQKYWVGTYQGVFLVDNTLEPMGTSLHFLKDHAISGILRDHEGNYWIGTLHSGMYIIPSLAIQNLNKSNSTMVKNEIISMLKAGPEQLVLLDNLGNLYAYHLIKNRLMWKCNVTPPVGTMVYNPIENSVYIESKGYKYNLDEGKSDNPNLIDIKAGTAIDSIHFLVSSSAGSYITSFEDHPAKVPLYAAWQKQYKTINDMIPSGGGTLFNRIVLRRVRSYTNTVCKATRTLYVSYNDGLFAYDTHAEQYQIIHNNRPLIITALWPDANKGVWAANTKGHLFYIFENNVAHIMDFGHEISYIRQQHTTLFLGSNAGVFTYDIKTGEYDVINTLDGLPSNAVTGLEVANDTLFVATLAGLTKIPADYRYKNTVPPEVELNGITVNGQPYSSDKLLKLPHKKNSLGFTFSTYALRSQKTFSYAYRVLGIDSTWTTTPSNTINFPGLTPNSYTFEVKAINEDGVESTKVRHVHFRIDSPFYQKWWFYTLISLCSITVIGIVFKYRLAGIKKQKEMERQLAGSAITTLKAQMNPHFMFNAMTAIQSLILDGEQEEAYTYLTRFSYLIRENLNKSEESFVCFHEEFQLIQTYLELEKLRFGESFHYTITGAKDIGTIKIPTMIIQPFAENAVKHGLLHKEGVKNLRIHFQQHHKTLYCTITDNGIGRKASAAIKDKRKDHHQAFSTNAIEKRFKLLKSYYKVDLGFTYVDLEENNMPKGTQVQLKIPYYSDED
ncbi:MAG: histidine kinase [Bacteroidota bacterium]